MDKIKLKEKLKIFSLITSGIFLMGISISLLIVPNAIAPGGTSGSAVILHALFGIPTEILVFAINLPGLILGIFKFGFKFTIATIYASIILSLFIALFDNYPPLTLNPLLASIFGGVFLGFGNGLVYKGGAMTGGLDLIVLTVQQSFKHLKVSFIFLFYNIIIVLISAIVFGNIEYSMYAAVCIVILTKCINITMYSSDVQRVIVVVSKHHKEIALQLSKQKAGVTLLNGENHYKDTPTKVILCAVRKQMYPKVKESIYKVDPAAFTITMLSSDIYGHNFKVYRALEF